jgi:hypothetical protein
VINSNKPIASDARSPLFPDAFPAGCHASFTMFNVMMRPMGAMTGPQIVM